MSSTHLLDESYIKVEEKKKKKNKRDDDTNHLQGDGLYGICSDRLCSV